jgi:hypothetical protein
MIFLESGTRDWSNFPNYWGQLVTPYTKPKIQNDRLWAMDNGAFNDKFNPRLWLQTIDEYRAHQDACLFVVAPDSYANCLETMDRYRFWAWQIKAMGWPVAFVAQDGQESHAMPEFDALFIGGTTDWKLGNGAKRCIEEAQKRDKWTHVGRVNTGKRIRHFQLLGVDSIDGTALAFGVKKNFRWINKQLAQLPLSDLIY